MCEAPICKCHCAIPSSGLKLEVGKTYKTNLSGNVKIISQDGDMFVGRVINPKKSTSPELWAYHSDGKRYGAANYSPATTIVSEWKEPVVTKRDIIMFHNVTHGPLMRFVECRQVGEQPYVGREYIKEISRQTVTFTE